MADLGIGLVGCGVWGQILARDIEEVDGARMVAVQNRTLSTAQSFASELDVVAHDTVQELLADPNVEAVLVSNPHSLHEETVVAAAEVGKHVFCEKPLAIDVAACYRMIDATDRHGVKLMCGQVTRLYPLYKRVAEIARGGGLGRLSAMHISNMVERRRTGWWARSETMGALLHSPGVHFVDFLLHICGMATSVYAVEAQVCVQETLDYQDSLFLLIEFENGIIGSLECSFSCLTPGQRAQIVGTLGSLTYDPRENWVQVTRWNGEQERIEVGPEERRAHMHIGVRAELQSFVDWVVRGAEPVLTGWDGLRAVEVIDAAYRSIARKQPISLPLPRT
jgi:predicted dehydrogenase